MLFLQVKLRRISALIGTSNSHLWFCSFSFNHLAPSPKPPPRHRALPLISNLFHVPPQMEEVRGERGTVPGREGKGKGMCRCYLFIVQILVPGVERLSLLLSNKNPTYSLFNQMLSSVILSYFLLYSRCHICYTKKQKIELRRKCRHSCFYHVYENFTVYYNKSQWCYCCKTVFIF